jgi:hypothetical protein
MVCMDSNFVHLVSIVKSTNRKCKLIINNFECVILDHLERCNCNAKPWYNSITKLVYNGC